jgi:hypothetical protein
MLPLISESKNRRPQGASEMTDNGSYPTLVPITCVCGREIEDFEEEPLTGLPYCLRCEYVVLDCTCPPLVG